MLIIVPTPIGNLEDITLRALRALREADVIACEDTRRTLKLLNRYGIKKPLISCHQHNERAVTRHIIERAKAETVALVSDAGTPGISDPGWYVVQEALACDLPVDVLPGANALLPALLLSGLPTQPFTFVGFLQGKRGERMKRAAALAAGKETLVFYVAPHDLADELRLLREALGNRSAALCREISKLHEETLRGSLDWLIEVAESRLLRGEMVLVVAGAEEEQAEDGIWQDEALRLRREGFFDKAVANEIASRYGIARNLVKTFLLKEDSGNDEE